MLSQVLISAFTCHLWNFPWSVTDTHRLFQNILNPKQVQEYLKCLDDMAIMKGLTQVAKLVSIPNKASSPKLVLSYLGIEITTKEQGSQRSFSKVMNVLKKNASHWEAFFVSASCKKGRHWATFFILSFSSYKVQLR
ncbi:TPA: hypothetical protein NKP40_004532 [Vibrio parahaemolyticus]|nr:hypothetical protein [Vibrio parahaemolyticus]